MGLGVGALGFRGYHRVPIPSTLNGRFLDKLNETFATWAAGFGVSFRPWDIGARVRKEPGDAGVWDLG